MTITEATIQEQIQELLREGREGAIRREKSAFDQAVGPRGRSLVLFGAGGIGQELKSSIDILDFPRVFAILLIILVMVSAVANLRDR